MDVALNVLNLILTDATVILFTIIVGTMYITLTYPGSVASTAVGVLMAWLIHRNSRLRRLWCWLVWFPLIRSIHRLTVPARRRMVGFLMCKVKKSVVADIIDTALRDAIDTKHITYHDYRELCAKIGEALDVSDLIPKGKRWRDVTRRIIQKNIEETRTHINAMPPRGTIPGPPEPAQPGHQELHYLRKRNVA